MAKVVKRTEAMLPRVRWSDEEVQKVAMAYVPMRYAQPHLTIPALCEEAQKVLPKDRQRSFLDSTAYAIATRMTNFWNSFAAGNPTEAQRLLAEAKVPEPEATAPPAPEPPPAVEPAPPAKEKPGEYQPAPPAQDPIAPVTSLVAPFRAQQPASVEPVATPVPQPAATPFLGPLEIALQAMVQRAVEGTIMTIMNHFDGKMETFREEFQAIVNAQHDSLLSYFDPEFKRMREVAAEFVTESIDSPRAKLETVRMTKKKVLIVCTNNIAGIQRTLEPKFNGIDFTFVDGGATKLRIDGFYDLVLCNATNRPSVREKCTYLHGQKTHFISGGTASMIEEIRKRLAI